jgi:hypothetical protein
MVKISSQKLPNPAQQRMLEQAMSGLDRQVERRLITIHTSVMSEPA